jgi:hypothetical protein
MKSNDENPAPGRRDALKTIVAGAGGLTTLPILGQPQPPQAQPPSEAQSGKASTKASEAPWKPLFFDDHQNETIVVLTDLIIPETATPGAKSALVNRYIDLRYNEESRAERERLIQGLSWLDGRSFSLHGNAFIRLTSAQQTAVLAAVANHHNPNPNPEDQMGVEFFQLVKRLTIFGYYTSEIALEQELKYRGDTYNVSFPGACTHPEHQT